MQTFSRRCRKGLEIHLTNSNEATKTTADYDELFSSQDVQEQTHRVRDQPPPALGLQQTSPCKPGNSNHRVSAAKERQHITEDASFLQSALVPSTTSNSTKGKAKPSGRSTAKAPTSGSVPGRTSSFAAPSKESVRSKRSGRLLGANKTKAGGSSGRKRRSMSFEANRQVETTQKRAKCKPAENTALPAFQEEPPVATPSGSLTIALPKAMARLFNPAALRDGAPAQTVMEAQELGEQSIYRDNAMWAMDGLCLSSNQNTQRESVVALLDICINRRGRMALLNGGVVRELFVTLGKLELADHAELALGAAAIIACFCQSDANPAVLADESTTHLMAVLLKNKNRVQGNNVPSSFAGRVMKHFREGFLARLVPPEESSSPGSVVLAALAGLLDPSQGCLNLDPCKHSLRTAGVLQQAANLAADHAQAISDNAPTMHTVQALWKLNKALVVLENACFACPANEEYLTEVKVREPTKSEELVLPEWIVGQVQILGEMGLSTGFKKDCLKALLAVLMNMTQNNLVGCKSVVSCGVLEVVGSILKQVVAGGQRNAGCLKNSTELDSWVDELSCCLGLLINLMEHRHEWRECLRELPIVFVPGAAANGKDALEQQEGIVPLLCALLTFVIPNSRYLETSSPSSRRLSTLSTEEITLETLDAETKGGAGSIVEVYTAVLLGFLIEGSPSLQKTAAALLPTHSVGPVVAAIARCLDFYVRTGAMTKKNEDSLRHLLASLEKDSSVCKQVKAG